MLLLGGALMVAVLAGLILPILAGAFGDSYARIAALPALLMLGGLFIFNKRMLLLLVFLLRASGDIVLESTRVGSGGASLGLGGAINALVILIAILFVIEKPKLLPRKAVAAWMIFLAVEAIGVLVSPNKGPAVKAALALCSYFAVFISAFYVVRKPEDFRFMVRLIVASSIIPVLYGVVVTGLSARGGLATFRLQSTFGHPNIFAFYLTLVIALGLYMIKSPAFKLGSFPRIMLAGYGALLFIMLLLTQTRSAWVGSFVLFVLYGVVFQRRYLIYILVLCCLALLVPSVQQRVLDLDSGNTVATYARLNSFAWRMFLWESALNWMSGARYLIGYGVEAFPFYSGVFFPLAGGIQWAAHSVFVQLIFDIGIIGLGTYLAVFYTVLRVLIRFFPQDRLAGTILICTLVEYLVMSASDNMLAYLAFNWYFWLVMGMGWSLYFNSEAYRLDPRNKVRGVRLAGAN